MSLIDTSAWIEYLRDGDQPTADAVEVELSEGTAKLTEPVHMEILQGGRSKAHVSELEALLGRAELVKVEGGDFFDAAGLYRQCRVRGATIRSSIDCLIGAVAVRNGFQVLHLDKDFDALGRHTRVAAFRA